MILLAVAGNPILHSKSPAIYAALFKHHSIPASYGRIHAGSAEELIFLFKSIGLRGMNVTAPFKQTVLPHLDDYDLTASLIGGANTIIDHGGRLHGFNTDYKGVTAPLLRRGVDPAGKRCLVLGAGGAARAAVYDLMFSRADITVVNRTYEKAVDCASRFVCRAAKLESLKDLLRESDILINTVPCVDRLLRSDDLPRGLVILDAIYHRLNRSILARKKSLTYIPGEEWLLDQALAAFSLFKRIETSPPFFRYGDEDPVPYEDAVMRPIKKTLRAPVYPPEKTANISLIGFMGSGKSTAGKILARRLGFDFIDTDHEIEHAEGRSVPEIFERAGEPYFREKEKAVVRRLAAKTKTVMVCGGGAILDRGNRNVLKKHSLVAWLFSSLDTTLKRLESSPRPLLRGEDPRSEAKRLFDQRKAFYAQTADIIFSSEKSGKEVADAGYDEVRQTLDD